MMHSGVTEEDNDSMKTRQKQKAHGYVFIHPADGVLQHWPEGTFSIFLHCFLVHHLPTVSGIENARFE